LPAFLIPEFACRSSGWSRPPAPAPLPVPRPAPFEPGGAVKSGQARCAAPMLFAFSRAVAAALWAVPVSGVCAKSAALRIRSAGTTRTVVIADQVYREIDSLCLSPEPSGGDAFVSVDWCRGPEHHARGVRTANWLLTCPPSMTSVVFRSRCNAKLPVLLQGTRAGFVDSL